jgi:phosphate transport system ATP-binding protein
MREAPRNESVSTPRVRERSRSAGDSRVVGDRLRTIELSAWFGTRQVLRGITLSVPDRRVTSIIGPSGCGKSTFLRCLNRMHEMLPRASVSGTVLLDDQDIYGPDVNPARVRRRVGMVFQKPIPFPTMSIRDNVLAGLRLNGMLPVDAEEVVTRVLGRVALWDEVKDLLDRSVAALSPGQQQRLCMARCLAVEPDVILMDEPCSSLDPMATAKIEELIHELRPEHAIVYVTHNLQQAARVGDYTAFIHEGEVIEHGPTDVLFTQPEEQRTEDYLTGRFG